MRVIVKTGDILDEQVDALICSANPQLNMSGGVNGALLLRGGQEVQRELHAHLARSGRRWVEPGTIVRTSSGPLRVKFILHAVAIDAMYQSDIALVQRTIAAALAQAAEAGAGAVALAALATGYGRMRMTDFAVALQNALRNDAAEVEELRVVVHREQDAEIVREQLGREPRA